MALIDTEEAAKRLARVILSDIELYRRERPEEGRSLEAQVEEGSRLFGTRVTPALHPLFAEVLANRRAGNENTPLVQLLTAEAQHGSAVTTPQPSPLMATDAPLLANSKRESASTTPSPLPMSETPTASAGTGPAPASEHEKTPGPITSAPIPNQHGTPSPVPRAKETRVTETRNNVRRIVVPKKNVPEAATAVTGVTPAPQVPLPANEPAAAPIALSLPVSRTSIPPAERAPKPSPDVASVPVLTSRFSPARWLALAGVTAATVALLYRFLP